MDDVLHTTGTTGHLPHDLLRPGDVFAGYRIDRLLRAGDLSAVYLVHHRRLPRLDELEVLSAAVSREGVFALQFEHAATRAQRLVHPNIAAVYEHGRDDGHLWITRRHVPAPTAAHLLASRRAGLAAKTAVRIIGEVGRGLDHAHPRAVVHRDVHPANILLPNGETGQNPVQLTGFGVARALDDVARLTDTGTIVPTIRYPAPENLGVQGIDGRADVYALGCTLYELLTGRSPYPLEHPLAAVDAHLHADPPRPSDVNPDLPVGFDAVIARALGKKPGYRYSTCRELTAAAQRALRSPSRSQVTAATATPPTAPADVPRSAEPALPRPKHARARALVAAAALAIIGATASGVASIDNPDQPQPYWQQAANVVSQIPRQVVVGHWPGESDRSDDTWSRTAPR